MKFKSFFKGDNGLQTTTRTSGILTFVGIVGGCVVGVVGAPVVGAVALVGGAAAGVTCITTAIVGGVKDSQENARKKAEGERIKANAINQKMKEATEAENKAKSEAADAKIQKEAAEEKLKATEENKCKLEVKAKDLDAKITTLEKDKKQLQEENQAVKKLVETAEAINRNEALRFFGSAPNETPAAVNPEPAQGAVPRSN